MAKKKKTQPKVKTSMHTRDDGVAPTPERVQKAGDAIERGATGTVRIGDAPLERLRKRGAITEDQYQAGYRFREIYNNAGLQAHYGSQDLNRIRSTDGPSCGMASSEFMANARGRYRRCVDLLLDINPTMVAVAHDVIVHEVTVEDVGRFQLKHNDRAQATAAALTALKIILDVFAREFGIVARRAA
jgi:hypothetical protein